VVELIKCDLTVFPVRSLVELRKSTAQNRRVEKVQKKSS